VSGLQVSHVAPFTPHVAKEGVLHVPAEQHPDAQDVESQMQLPPTQRCPTEQGPAEPQEHWPSAEQLSAAVALQLAHASPAGAHVDKVRGVQTLPVQQPFGQDVALQTQVPPEQTCPVPQGGPLPQAQLPVAEQLFATVAVQAMHAEPFFPHVPRLLGLHEAP
jgi:hypothetical protein